MNPSHIDSFEAGGVILHPNERLMGVLPVPANLCARFALTGSPTPQFRPLMALVVIRGRYGEADAIHRLDGFLESGHALASDVEGFEGFAFCPTEQPDNHTPAAITKTVALRLAMCVRLCLMDKYVAPSHAAFLLDALGVSDPTLHPVKTEGIAEAVDLSAGVACDTGLVERGGISQLQPVYQDARSLLCRLTDLANDVPAVDEFTASEQQILGGRCKQAAKLLGEVCADIEAVIQRNRHRVRPLGEIVGAINRGERSPGMVFDLVEALALAKKIPTGDF